MAIDLICGMTVDEASMLRTERDGQTFYFCSDHCRQEFLSTPATAVARQLGLDAAEAQIKPAGKVAHVKKLRAEGKHVAMAGDSINDAPALRAAEVGIAMGTGTDVAMQSGGITLVRGDLRGIAKAIRLSRATMRNIRQNLFFALALSLPAPR